MIKKFTDKQKLKEISTTKLALQEMLKELFQAKLLKDKGRGFPVGAVVENLPANAGDAGSSPGLGGSHMPRSN